MNSSNGFRISATALAVIGVFAAPANVLSGPTSLANEPLATGLSSVPPNIMFILDDSGSMDSHFTPDYVGAVFGTTFPLCRNSHDGSADKVDSASTLKVCAWGDPPYTSPQFNFQYYNPNVRYKAPYHPSDAGKTEDDNTRVYPMYNNVGTNQQWATLKTDPFTDDLTLGPSASSTINLLQQNQDIVACNITGPTEAQKNDTTVCKSPIDMTLTPAGETAGTGTYLYPNPRFNATAHTSVAHFRFRITRSGTSTYPMAPYFYSITKVEWCKNTSATNPTAGYTQGKHRFGKGTSDTAAAAYATNPCTDRKVNIGGTDYKYAKYGKVAHNSANDTATQNGRLDAASNPAVLAGVDYEGISGFRRWDIVDAGGNTLAAGYPANNYLGGGTLAPARNDCAGAACTYTEEMTNYANWYAYYRTRLLAMKTATSRAFEGLSTNYRVGFITICPDDTKNCNTSPFVTVSPTRYLKIDDFSGAHRTSWFGKLFSIKTHSFTPLREALARAGQIFAGSLNTGLTLGIPVADDPVIASCQQNFAILTTDGYWNGPAGKKPDGTAIGDQDTYDTGAPVGYVNAPRPFYDGPNTGSQTATDTLADVAFYYYVNDLRPSMTNDVPTTAKDTASHQHMTTFTLGLGIDGRMKYQGDYETAGSGDYYNIKQGTANWPKPASDTDTAVDDLWHAAVNGRGKYFSAQNPELLAAGLSEALTEVGARVGAGAAAATSSLRPSAGDQLAFTAQYETVKWHGDLKARTIDVDTASSTFGQVSTRDLWSAQTLLDAKVWTSRNILTLDAADTTGDLLKSFCYDASGTGCTSNGAGLSPGEKTYFDPVLLNQYSDYTAAQKDGAAGGVTAEKVVNYLRGERANEGIGTTLSKLFRVRDHVLGDIVNSQPVYVKKPPFDYADNYYSAFKTNNLTRQAVVFSGANDGMLHAYQVDPDNSPYYQIGGFATAATGDDTFSTGSNDGGGESWAYIPGVVLPRLTALGNSSAYTHQYTVDGSPVVSDVCVDVPCSAASKWRTILVSGLNGGGRGYYALDITNPVSPKGLWEFTTGNGYCPSLAEANSGTFSSDCRLGYTYGTPIVTKWKNSIVGNDGRWVVLVTSGYNNFNPGTGRGYLWMLDAITGKILGRVGTGVGSGGTGPDYLDADPSGLAKINLWLDNGLVNNTGEHVYGGDLKGNVWRFNIGGAASTWTSTLITVAKDASNNPQPITVRPELGYPKNKRVVFFGTGKYLGNPDTTDTSAQSIYGIKDDLSGTAVDIRGTGVVSRSFGAETTLADGAVTRSIAAGGTALDFADAAQFGFRIDFPTAGSGERVNVDLALQVGTLVVASNIPNTTGSCSAGGSAWENYINFMTGESVQAVSDGSGGTGGAKKFSSGLIVGTTIVQLPGGKTVAITTSADTKQTTSGITAGGSGAGTVTGKRSSWREIITE